MNTLYMLDTNVVSDIVKDRLDITQAIGNRRGIKLCISAIAHAEIIYGLARKPQAVKLAKTTHAFLKQVQVMDFDSQVSCSYGHFRREMELSGKNLQPLDLLIASHAHYLGAVLVTSDKAFAKIEGLRVESWG